MPTNKAGFLILRNYVKFYLKGIFFKNPQQSLNQSFPPVPHITAKIEGDFVQKPSVQVIAKIAKAPGVSIEELIK